MISINVPTGKPYQVLIGHNFLEDIGSYMQKLNKKYANVAVIADSNVAPLYANTVIDSVKIAGYNALDYVFPAGEESKSINETMKIISWLSKNSFTRSDLIIALGGGVTGDLVGFVSAIYLRGCDFIQIPTTLLAAVDSSVGGKTAIDIPEGKNLVGAFWQPKVVLCDTKTFSTLSTEAFADGVAEAIKYGCIWDKDLYSVFTNKAWMTNELEITIARCIQMKADIVAQDENDYGIRQILNFGHTVAHGIESLSHFSISHGQAVAIGMCVVTRSEEKQGNLPVGTSKNLEEMLSLYQLPTTTSYSAKELTNACLSDKKREGESINIISLKAIGTYSIQPTLLENLEEFIERGL